MDQFKVTEPIPGPFFGISESGEGPRIKEVHDVRAWVKVARLHRQLEVEGDNLCENPKEAVTGKIVGQSAALRGVLEQVEMVAPTDATVLIVGESGTGKELIASAIHEGSPRRSRPMVCVNCGSIPSELFESEFFGHAKGSFTGAIRDRVGRFQLADGGTLFLDEVGEIPLAQQAKLLRVLQHGQFERVGDDVTRRVNVRVIAASNKNLKQEADARHFRQDLYYRLSVFPIQVPPLRDRKNDIQALADHFVSLFSTRLNRPKLRFTNDDADLLKQYDWPGNVRELQNVIERAMILATGERLRLDLALAHTKSEPSLLDRPTQVPPESARAKIVRSNDLKRIERESIVAALEHARQRISGAGGAAELLGINPSTLFSRIRSLGISRKSQQDAPRPCIANRDSGNRAEAFVQGDVSLIS